MASDCPDKVQICSNCKGSNHGALDCKNNRVLSRHHVADKLPEQAWEMIGKASDERDIDDFKEVGCYCLIYAIWRTNTCLGSSGPL